MNYYIQSSSVTTWSNIAFYYIYGMAVTNIADKSNCIHKWSPIRISWLSCEVHNLYFVEKWHVTTDVQLLDQETRTIVNGNLKAFWIKEPFLSSFFFTNLLCIWFSLWGKLTAALFQNLEAQKMYTSCSVYFIPCILLIWYCIIDLYHHRFKWWHHHSQNHDSWRTGNSLTNRD